MIDQYEKYKEDYLSYFSPEIVEMWRALESREDWTIDTQLKQISNILNNLPHYCRYPLNDETSQTLGELIALIAYLPFVESITALSWCGFNSGEWGDAIYNFAYSTLNDAWNDSDLMSQQHVIAAKTIVMRVEEVSKISTIQSITGSAV